MTLEEVRVQIDQVDKEIKELFCKRMALADNVATVKAETADAIFKPDREEIIIEKQSADVEESIRKEYIAFIKRVMEVSRKYQYGRTLELRDCFDINYATEQEAIKKADSSEGILENADGKWSDETLQRLCTEKKYINRCKAVAEDGQVHKEAEISDSLVVLPEHNRIMITFSCQDKLNGLAKLLTMITDYDVDITQMHTVVKKADTKKYQFYFELKANLLEKEIKALLFQLENESKEFQVIGSYSL